MLDFDLELAPRDGGLTHVIDKGLGPRVWEDVLETCGDTRQRLEVSSTLLGYLAPNRRGGRDRRQRFRRRTDAGRRRLAAHHCQQQHANRCKFAPHQRTNTSSIAPTLVDWAVSCR